MVITQNIECQICDKEYFVRIGVGVDEFQKHSFDCLECEQPIVVGVRAVPPNANAEAIENAECKAANDTKTVINLHPGCAFDPDEYHERMTFPSMNHVHMVQPFMREVPGKFQDLATQFNIPNAPKRWIQIKAILRLSPTPKNARSRKRLVRKYIEKRKNNGVLIAQESALDVVTDFLDFLFYPKVNELADPVIAIIDKLNEDAKLGEFIRFYQKNLQTENQERYIATMSSFMRFRDQLGQLIDYARISNEEVDDKIVGSRNFDEMKLYYGEVYEALTSNFTTLACINNLLKGRNFDTFAQMNLNKYMKDVEKAKRHNPFEDIPELNAFALGLDSSLRNGSHHASIWRKGELIMYRSGGSGAQREMSYSRYLHICNVLTISLAAIFLVELHLQKTAGND